MEPQSTLLATNKLFVQMTIKSCTQKVPFQVTPRHESHQKEGRLNQYWLPKSDVSTTAKGDQGNPGICFGRGKKGDHPIVEGIRDPALAVAFCEAQELSPVVLARRDMCVSLLSASSLGLAERETEGKPLLVGSSKFDIYPCYLP